MRKITIFDTTLRDGEQSPGCGMGQNEKLELARQIALLGADVLEAGFPASSPGDAEAVARIAAEVRDVSVAALCRALKTDIDAGWQALSRAQAPLLHVFLATSPIHMKYKLRMSEDEVADMAAASVAYAKRYCAQVEFSAEDASRSDRDFLCRVFSGAVAAGATVINIPDTVGYAAPGEMAELVKYVSEHTVGAENVKISVHCHNDLGMAVANSLSSIAAGAGQVECTVNGIGERAGNAALEEIVMALETRRDFFGAGTGIDTRQIYRTSRLLSSVVGLQIPKNKPVVGDNAFAHEAGVHQHGMMAERTTYEIMSPESVGFTQEIVLGKHSGRHAFEERLVSLGYTLPKSRINELFEQFKKLCDKKKDVTDRDIENLAGRRDTESIATYKLSSFVINSGNTIPATARITMAKDGRPLDCVAVGDGPVDAAFRAIASAVGGESFELSDYQIRAVTGGGDALGEAVLKLARNGRSVAARGVSDDIIEASIRAYINGVNRLLYAETE